MARKTRGITRSKLVCAARENRRTPTPAEEKLWSVLRGSQLANLRFRRQHPIGSYILDFFCVTARLAVELDGAVHADPAQAEYDRSRTEWLIEQGVRVLRFNNHEIENHLARVRARIIETAQPVPVEED